MEIHIGPETSLFWDTPMWSLYYHVLRNYLVSEVLVCVEHSNQLWLLWFRVLGGYSTTRKEIRMIRGDLYLSWKWRRVVPCSSLQNELHKRGMCRYAFYPWWSAREFSWGRTVAHWKVSQPPDTQSSFWTIAANQYICIYVLVALINKLIMFSIPFTLCNACVLKTSKASTVKVRLSDTLGEWGVPIDRFCR
jgi:hypothetical protein